MLFLYMKQLVFRILHINAKGLVILQDGSSDVSFTKRKSRPTTFSPTQHQRPNCKRGVIPRHRQSQVFDD